MTPAAQIVETALRKGVLIATAESCTAGMISVAITDIAGSSSVFDRGFVTYSNTAKMDMTGVQPSTLASFGAVSEEVVREMAEGALKSSGAQIAVAVSGIAGPGGSEHKPEGRVCFALSCENQITKSETIEFGAIGRAQVRQATVNHALEMLLSGLASFDDK